MNLLVRAATLGDIDTVRDMLQAREIDPTECDLTGDNALHIACRRHQQDIALMLIADGRIDVNLPGRATRTALHLCALEGLAEVMKGLIAVDGIDVNAILDNRKSAIEIAARKEHLNIVSQLLSHPEINLVSRTTNKWLGDRWTLLHEACLNNQKQVVKLLLASGKVNVNEAGRQSFVMEQNLQHLEKRWVSPLHLACLHPDAEILSMILAAPLDLNVNYVSQATKMITSTWEGVTWENVDAGTPLTECLGTVCIGRDEIVLNGGQIKKRHRWMGQRHLELLLGDERTDASLGDAFLTAIRFGRFEAIKLILNRERDKVRGDRARFQILSDSFTDGVANIQFIPLMGLVCTQRLVTQEIVDRLHSYRTKPEFSEVLDFVPSANQPEVTLQKVRHDSGLGDFTIHLLPGTAGPGDSDTNDADSDGAPSVIYSDFADDPCCLRHTGYTAEQIDTLMALMKDFVTECDDIAKFIFPAAS